MGKWQLSGSALIAAVVIAAVAFVAGPLRGGWAPTIVSGIVLIAVFVFDRGPTRTTGQSLAYAAVCGFLVVTALIYPLYLFLPQMTASPADMVSSKPYLPIAWAVAAAIILAVDRMRANTRPITVTLASPEPVQPAVNTRPAPVVLPAPVPVAPAPEPAAAVHRDAAPEPAAIPVSRPAPVVPAPPPIPARAQVVSPVPAPKGKPATIYLNLVGSGISCLRAVKAEHLGQDFFKIVEQVPSGEAWEFQTGQIVRCRKRTLSSGKALVAYEEAPRAS